MLAERVPGPGPRILACVGAAALAVGLAAVPAGVAASAEAPGVVSLAIAVPLVVPEGTTGLISAEALAQYTSPLGLLSRQLDSVIDRPVAIGVDPAIIASIRILGTGAPPSATDWLDRLEGATNETFALAWSDADITLATQAGYPTVPGPESLDFAVDPALFAPVTAEPETTPTPTPTADPVDPDEPVIPTLPTTEELLDWPYSLSGVAWPRDDTVVTADLARISATGYDTTILSSGNVSAGTASGAVAAGSVATVGDETVLVSDAAISDALRTAAGALSVDDWRPAVTSLGAAVSAWGASRPATTAFATMDRSRLIGTSRLADTIDALNADPGIALVSMSDAIITRSAEATLVDQAQPEDSVARVQRMLASETADRDFATVAADPAAITSERRLLLLALLSASWTASPDGWAAAVDDYLADSRELRDSVHVVAGSSFTFIADRAGLPIAVNNDLDQEVTVYIDLRPQTAQLAVGDTRVELVLEPNSQARGDVPVQAISNGEVRVSVTLTSPTGVVIGDVTSADINVQAGWETPVVVVLAVLVVAFFGFGIVRNIVRRRKGRG